MFALERAPDGLRIRFSATLPLLDRAVDETVAFLQCRGTAGSLFDAKLLLREALLNAVVHGSRSDPALEVRLEVALVADRMHLCVTDQGRGFPWRERLGVAPSPEATSGRGLMIMTLYADELCFNPAGNQVRLVKRLAGSGCPATTDDRTGTANSSRRRS